MTRRALVLGGGGVTGIAWSLGLVAGLAEAGIDLTRADLTVGTSAGSAVGAQLLSGTDVEELYRRQLAGAGSEQAVKMSKRTMLRFALLSMTSENSPRARAKVGELALSADTPSEAERRAIIAERLPEHEWPEQRLLITAVDAHNGEFRAFDRDGEVSLVDAVAASCAVPGVWPPVRIDGRCWIDGGARSNINADLAADHERVLVIAPMATGTSGRLRKLRRDTHVELIHPDRDARRAIGPDPLDPARRAPAARAGRAQAVAAADQVAPLWRV